MDLDQRETVLKLLAELSGIPSQVLREYDPDAGLFVDGLSLGSIRLMELLFRLEQIYGIQVMDRGFTVGSFDSMNRLLGVIAGEARKQEH